MRIFGIDPGSIRTGYGCVETDGSRHRLVTCGALAAPGRASFPQRLQFIHDGLARLIATAAPECVAIENLFHARNVRSALMLGHARGVAVLAAVEAGLPVVEYTPAEIKLAVVGLRPRGESADAADGQAAARPRHRAVAARRRRRARRRDLSRAHPPARPRRPRAASRAHLRSWRHAKLPRARQTSSVRDRASVRHAPREAGPAARRRRRRRRLRRAGAALDVLRASASRDRPSRCASTRTCARTRCSSSGSRTALELTLSSG